MAVAAALTSQPRLVGARAAVSRRQLKVRGCSSPNRPGAPRPRVPEPNLLQQLKSGANNFHERYDILSTGAGALICTSFFWSRGQDPLEALWITFCATIAGLVLNEVLFGQQES